MSSCSWRSSWLPVLTAALVVPVSTWSACAAMAESAPGDRGVTAATLMAEQQERRLLPCPTTGIPRRTSEIGPEGGIMRAGHFTLDVPPGAVAETVTFSLAMEESNFRRVRIQVNGQDRYEFERSVILHVSTAGCTIDETQDVYLVRVEHDADRIIPDIIFSVYDPQRNTILARLERIGSGYAIGT